MQFHIRFLPISGADIRFIVPKPHATVVTLSPKTDHACDCEITVERSTNEGVAKIFRDLHDGTLDPHADHEWQAAGTYGETELRGPDNYREVVEDVRSHCQNTLLRIVGIVAWRLGQDWSPLSFYAPRWMQWSVNGVDWKTIPGVGGVAAVHSYSIPNLDGKVGEMLQGMLDRKEVEPLAHEIWREAWGLQLHFKRAALILGVSAVEIGIKELVIALEPGTEWLMNELPSPPVVKMLQDYLPLLVKKDSVPRPALLPPDLLITQLKKAITKRNQLVHRGGTKQMTQSTGDTVRPASWKDDALRQTLRELRDLLWLFDYYRGSTWTLRRLTPATRAALNLDS